jgi:exodeoxyribonuclease V alpha subunit
MNIEDLNTLIKESESFAVLDRRFADLMLAQAGADSAELWFAAALASQQTRQKHICFDLSRLGDPDFALEVFEEEGTVALPEPQQIIEALRSSKVVGRPGDIHPLILDDSNRLYLYRYWQYEQRLAGAIVNRAKALDEIDAGKTSAALTRYFDPSNGETDWQQIAAVAALSKRFCVISGGPGTGKTRTIGIILAMLIEQTERKAPIIKLAAPTGKAAVRLQESIKKLKQEKKFPEAIQQLIPEEASTLHRLLGYKRHSPYFRNDAGNPLDVDVVVVDEASMVAQPLMAKLMQALPERARLILLGDHSQLASVEAGSALADICEAGGNFFSDEMKSRINSTTGFEIDTTASIDSSIGDGVIELQKNYRFEGKGILELSKAVNAGESDRAIEIFKIGGQPDLRWQQLKMNELKRTIIEWLRDYPASQQPDDVFQQFDQFRILCALRHGPQGVREINALVDQFVRQKNSVSRHDEWYIGQPLLITRNDYAIELFNGDVGIILPDPDAGGELRAFFPKPDGDYRKIRPFRLPDHELAFAMTVHKSQGSEFSNVLLLLPEQDSPILTRELIYTGITRAAKKVEIWGNEDVFRLAVSRRIKRTSGLREALRK